MKEIIRLFSYAKNLRKHIVFVAAAGTISALLGMVAPFVIKFATDEVAASVVGKSLNVQLLSGLIIALVVAYVVSELLHNLTGYVGDMLAIRLRQQLSQAYYDHLLTLPQSYYDNEKTGTIISRLDRAIADVTRFIQMFSNMLLHMLLTIIIAIAVMCWYSWEIALVVIVQIPIYIYLTMRTSRRWQKMEAEKNQHLDIARGRFAEVVGQMRLVKSYGAESREAKFFANHFNDTVCITRLQSRYWHTMDTLRALVRVAVYVVVYAILFWRAAYGQITLGDMVLLITLLQQTNQPLQNMSFFVDMYQRAVANSKDYAAAMSELAESAVATRGSKMVTKSATVAYRGVTFAYGDKAPIVKNISFTIESGKKVALVSQSGGGKTTLSNLLMRLYEPKSGTITINDTPINEISAVSLRGMIATVFQDASLFSGSIRENIAYANPSATQAQIEKAARAANAYEFITALEDGFDTEIGERGIKLSGGQKQRIAIARAILKDAPILILDEATSALDSHAEHEVQIALDRLMKGRTTLIIAHRLSTIANVDTIVTLKGGQVDEIGSPQKLAATNGIYAQLLKLQFGTTKAARQKLKKFDMAS